MYSSDLCFSISESSLSYIRMVVVHMGRCRVFLIVLVPPIVLIRVGAIPVSQWSIHFVVSCWL